MAKNREKIFMVTNEEFVRSNILSIYEDMGIDVPSDNSWDTDDHLVRDYIYLGGTPRRTVD
jgi:hypothetical protein